MEYQASITRERTDYATVTIDGKSHDVNLKVFEIVEEVVNEVVNRPLKESETISLPRKISGTLVSGSASKDLFEMLTEYYDDRVGEMMNSTTTTVKPDMRQDINKFLKRGKKW